MAIDAEEVTRRHRVMDQMLTAHSILRDRYGFRAVVLDVLVLVFSATLVATSFLDPALLHWLNLSDQAARITIGIASVGVFIISLFQLRVDWKVRAASHNRAVEKLGLLKAQYRALRGSFDPLVAQVLLAKSNEILSELIPIPESEFATLKAQHLQKVEVSRLLDRYPSAPLLILKAKLSLRHTIAALRARNQPPEADK